MATTLDFVKAQLPDYANTYVKDMLSQTQAVTDINANPYQQYTGERVAGFQPLQQTAFTGAETMQPSAYTGQGAGIAGLAAQQALGAGQNFQPGQFQGGQFGSQEAQQYMNPYMQNVVDVQQREAQRQADIAGTQRSAQAVGAGGFGGSRQAIADAEAARNLATQKGDIQAQGLNTAYTNAQQQFNADQARRMSAEQLGEQSRQYGAAMGLQGAQTALQGATALGTLGNQQFGQQKDINELQFAYGTTQQANQQAKNDVGFQNFQAAQNYPKEQLAFRSSMLNALPMGGSVGQTTTQDQPNYMNTLLGAGLSFLGMAEGGEVKRMAVGGSVSTSQDFSMMSDPALEQALFAAKARRDAPTVLLLEAESAKRKQTRTAAQGQQTGQQPRTVADQVMSGIANLPSGDSNYADGGIVAFAAGGVSAASFGEFLRAQGVAPSDFSRMSKAAQSALRSMFSNATMGPAASAGAAPAAPAVTAPAAPAGAGGYATQPSTYGQRALSGIRGLFANPGAAGAAVGVGGALLSTGAANALSNASDEELDMLSQAGGGDDTATVASIMRQARKNAEMQPPAAAPGTPDARDAEAGMSRGRPATGGITALQTTPAPRGSGGAPRAAGPAGPAAPAPVPAAAPVPLPEASQTFEDYMAAVRKNAEADNAEYARMNEDINARAKTQREELTAPRDKVKEFLSGAGKGLMGSKEPYFDLRSGLSAGFAGIQYEDERRKEKLALLDAAEEKRQLATMADRRGNTAAAAEYHKQYQDILDKAKTLAGSAETRAEAKRHNIAVEKEAAAGRQQRGSLASARASGIAGLSKSSLPVLKQQAADVKAQLAAFNRLHANDPDMEGAREVLEARQQAINEAIAKLPGAVTIGTPGASPGGIKFVGVSPKQ